MKFTTRWLSSLILLVVPQAVPAQITAADSTRWGVPARNFIELIQKADFAGAAALTSPLLPAGTFSATRLQELWRAVNVQAGVLRTYRVGQIRSQGDSLHFVDFEATFERAGMVMRVVLDRSAKVAGFGFLQPGGAGAAPALPPYADTTRSRETTVSFGKPDWRLEGTLTLPRSFERPPVLILVHGSGPNDRDETLGPNKPFRDLALGLAARGIAVFRYDKRTLTHRAKFTSPTITLEDEVIDDALLAAAEMRRQPGVDSNRVYMLGHSLGGFLVPEISRRDGRLAGIILAAAPARPFADVLASQLAYLDSLARAAGDSIPTALGRARVQLDSLRNRGLADTVVVVGVPASYWYSLDRIDARRAVREQRSRVLLLQGGRDYQSTMEDFRLWQTAFTGSGMATFKSYPNLNHLFIAGSGRATPREYQLLRGFVAPEVIADIAAWMGVR
jgi:alpha-beta hydrolase superfamily lysophospholipase